MCFAKLKNKENLLKSYIFCAVRECDGNGKSKYMPNFNSLIQFEAEICVEQPFINVKM